jgi:hypothetical protein
MVGRRIAVSAIARRLRQRRRGKRRGRGESDSGIKNLTHFGLLKKMTGSVARCSKRRRIASRSYFVALQ